jgi:type IV pilus assembly protein PilM
MFERRIVGLDLGSWSVKAVELKAGLRGVEFVRLEELILPPEAGGDEREANIQLFLDRSGFEADTVAAAMPGDRITQRHLRLPFSGKARIDQTVAFEVEETLPVPLDTMVLTHEQVSSSADQTDVLAVLCPSSDVSELLERLQRLDADPRVLEIGGAVLANLSRYAGLDDVPRLMVDVGHRTTDLCLLLEGKPVAVRSVPIAGEHLTAAIAEARDVTAAEAERIKHEEGVFEPDSSKPASPELRHVLERLTREIQRSVHAVAGDQLDRASPSEVVLMGGSAQLPGLAEFLRERTGMPCRVISFPTSTGESSPWDDASHPSFATAAALALRLSNTEAVTGLDLRKGEHAYTPDLSGLGPQLQATVARRAASALRGSSPSSTRARSPRPTRCRLSSSGSPIRAGSRTTWGSRAAAPRCSRSCARSPSASSPSSTSS